MLNNHWFLSGNNLILMRPISLWKDCILHQKHGSLVDLDLSTLPHYRCHWRKKFVFTSLDSRAVLCSSRERTVSSLRTVLFVLQRKHRINKNDGLMLEVWSLPTGHLFQDSAWRRERRSMRMMSFSQIQEESIDDEQGELRGKDDREFRSNAEKNKAQVIWNIERRCFLLSQGSHRFILVLYSFGHIQWIVWCSSLQNQITRVPYLAVEIVRTAAPTAPKGKKVPHLFWSLIDTDRFVRIQDEDAGISYHGVAYIETAPLLYPGGKSSIFFWLRSVGSNIVLQQHDCVAPTKSSRTMKLNTKRK